MNPAIVKKRLGHAFRALRKQGYTAKSRFWCCTGCAMNAINADAAARASKGVVFYHKQIADLIDQGRPFYLCTVRPAGGDVAVITSVAVTALREAGLDARSNHDYIISVDALLDDPIRDAVLAELAEKR